MRACCRWFGVVSLLMLPACSSPKPSPPDAPPLDQALTLDQPPASDLELDRPRPAEARADLGGSDQSSADTGPTQNGPWLVHAPGLEVGIFAAGQPTPVSDGKVHVVRVDPAHYDFKLLAAGELKLTANKTVPQWVAQHGLVGAINASMYQTDHLTSVFYMQNGTYLNNPKWHSSGNAVFASNGLDATLPRAQIIDKTCQDLEQLKLKYSTLVQNYRMLACDGSNAWSPSSNIYSIACVGQDSSGRILFIHCRSPYSTHDLANILNGLPLGLSRLMYVEGGPEASLYVLHGGKPIVSRVGSYETSFWENDSNTKFWPVPNVIGFVARP